MQSPDEITFISLTVSLFLVFNAFGQIPVFLALLAPYSAQEQRKIIFRELVIALVTILLFVFFGAEILHLLGISHAIIGMVGGLLLLLIAINLIFPREVSDEGLTKNEPIIIPLAIPGLAGPGTMTAVMVFATQKGVLFTSAAFFLAWIPSLILILLSSFIKNIMGRKGLLAIQKLGGMIIALIGINMLMEGIISVVKKSFFL